MPGSTAPSTIPIFFFQRISSFKNRYHSAVTWKLNRIRLLRFTLSDTVTSIRYKLHVLTKYSIQSFISIYSVKAFWNLSFFCFYFLAKSLIWKKTPNISGYTLYLKKLFFTTVHWQLRLQLDIKQSRTTSTRLQSSTFSIHSFLKFF